MTPREKVLLAARAALVEDGELDMGEVARRAGVGRSTLYRLCGDREGLRELVVRWMAEVGWARALRAGRGEAGRARCLAVLSAYTRLVVEDQGLRKAVQAAPDKTVALCTDHRRSVQPYVVDQVEKLLADERDALGLTVPLDLVAFAVVRLSESFVYADVLAGRDSDLDALGQLVALLLPPTSWVSGQPRGHRATR